MKRNLLVLSVLFSLPVLFSSARGAETAAPATPETGASAQPAKSSEEYLLRYKFAPDETIRWKVTHLGTTETKISGNTQSSKSRSVSTKLWQVKGIDPQGKITFSHSVENVDMWQQVSDHPEVAYNSQSGAEPPPEYRQVAQTVGKPLTSATITDSGQILEKGGESSKFNLGLGDIIMLLPPKPVRPGSSWYEPSELQVRQPDGRVDRIKIRKRYTLEKVQTGLATIQVKTEVLTPVDDPRIQAQLVQQLTNGAIKFDVDAGRIVSKQMDWDEVVVGFRGPDSEMKYLARFTEELVSDNTATASSQPAVPRR
jgi:hypothetical protein